MRRRIVPARAWGGINVALHYRSRRLHGHAWLRQRTANGWKRRSVRGPRVRARRLVRTHRAASCGRITERVRFRNGRVRLDAADGSGVRKSLNREVVTLEVNLDFPG